MDASAGWMNEQNEEEKKTSMDSITKRKKKEVNSSRSGYSKLRQKADRPN